MCNAMDNAIAKGAKIGEAIGEAIGETVGEARLAALIMLLYSCHKEDEVARVCRDKAYRYGLYKKYHIV